MRLVRNLEVHRRKPSEKVVTKQMPVLPLPSELVGSIFLTALKDEQGPKVGMISMRKRVL